MIGDWTIRVTYGREQPYAAWRETNSGEVIYWFHVSSKDLARRIERWCQREARSPRIKEDFGEKVGSMEEGRA